MLAPTFIIQTSDLYQPFALLVHTQLMSHPGKDFQAFIQAFAGMGSRDHHPDARLISGNGREAD